jgi:hypothetical protein
MIILKRVLIGLIVFHSTFIVAQETPTFEIFLRPNRLLKTTSTLTLDSVLISSGSRNAGIWHKNADKNDSVFKIAALPNGKYRIFPSSNGFMISPLTVSVCSKCEKNIEFVAFPSTVKFENQVFDNVEISPSYIGGNKAIASAIRKVLNESEIEKINTAPNFYVHFFVTKEKEISDITISPVDLHAEVKKILEKAIAALTNWDAAIINGRKSDGEYTVSKYLFTQLY